LTRIRKSEYNKWKDLIGKEGIAWGDSRKKKAKTGDPHFQYEFSMEVNEMKLIKTIVQGKLASTVTTGGCGACKNSCQSACKTSCTVGNQVCQK